MLGSTHARDLTGSWVFSENLLTVLLRVAVLAVAGALLAAGGADAAPSARPDTVPALDGWRGAEGTFVLRRDARVVVRARDRAALLGEARVLAADLTELTGRRVTVTAKRTARARAGDVVLGRTKDPALGSEGYRLRIGRSFDILAPAATGAFYGGRTLLQLRRAGTPIPRGRARDVPRYPERALMVDNGRVFYSRTWLEQRIEELASLKLNMLHLHISDNQGFRIESTTHPEAVTPPFLTHADIRRLVRVARRNHVTLVPEIDAPGHMEAALRAHPELRRRARSCSTSSTSLRRCSPAPTGTRARTSTSACSRARPTSTATRSSSSTRTRSTARARTARTPCSTS
jgi:hexosaminidase